MSKRNIDYAFKSYVINNHSDLLSKQKRAKLKSYAIDNFIDNGVYSKVLDMKKYDIDSNELYFECLDNGLINVYKECIKINKASYQRTKRLKNRVGDMLLNGNCIFVTLTFNDNALNSLDYKQRRVAVSRFLKSHKCKYVANVDYGSKNHREHYHALINCEHVDLTAWRYGAINVERIRNKDIESDKTKLAKYIAKLSNHAIKETTKRCSLIYSR